MVDAQAILKSLGVAMSGVCADSRRLQRGDLFLAYPGERDDGRRYIAQAVAAQAAAVVWDPSQFAWSSDWKIPNVSQSQLRQHAGYFADAVYRQPSRAIPVIAITGTNGKTTTSFFAAQLLEANGTKTGLIGTLGMGRCGGQLHPLVNTTPEAAVMHAGLRQMIDSEGIGAAVVEASSHGLSQGRLNGMHVRYAVLTNLGYDHLDYHRDFDDYQNSKALLFALPGLQAAILNSDDAFSDVLQSKLSLPIQWYGRRASPAADVLHCTHAVATNSGYVLQLSHGGRQWQTRTSFYGRHNISNLLAAVCVAMQCGVSLADIIRHVPQLQLPAGRLQQISNQPRVFVDFAHTPDAFQTVLSEMRTATQQQGQQLIVVFGCGGDRDRGKRGEMGTLAQTFADIIVVTDDNPRGEDPAAIRSSICRAVPKAYNIGSRYEAIAHALAMADKDDTVLILGKGHETYQERGGQREYFSDAAAVQQCLQSQREAHAERRAHSG